MGLTSDEVWQHVDDGRTRLADIFDDLAPREWITPSLCAGWRVRDVAAHLTLAHMGPVTAAAALLRARGSFDRMVHDTAVSRAREPVERYGPLLLDMVGSRRKAPGVSEREPLIDVLVHGLDITVPLHRELPVPADAAVEAAERVWAMGFPFHAQRRLDGVALIATDADWHRGSGTVLHGPMGALLLVLTGRAAGLDLVTGPGREALLERVDQRRGRHRTS